MCKTILLIPTGIGVGLNSVAQGLVQALLNQGIKVNFFKPIALHDDVTDTLEKAKPLSVADVEAYLRAGREDELLEDIVSRFQRHAKDADVAVVQGMIATSEHAYVERLNQKISQALDANIILVTMPSNLSAKALSDLLMMTGSIYGGWQAKHLLGVIVNKVSAPTDERGHVRFDLTEDVVLESPEHYIQSLLKTPLFSQLNVKLLGYIPWQMNLIAPRVKDIARLLQANILYPGAMEKRRITRIVLCARGVGHMLDALKPGTLIITPGDRDDIIVATALAALSGINIAALLLTGHYGFSKSTFKLCEQAITKGLPILSTEKDSFRTAITLHNLSTEVPVDDVERIKVSRNSIASHIDQSWLGSFLSRDVERHLTPPAFRYQLVEKAQAADKLIILPEGDELRTLRAVQTCRKRQIARFILLGDPEKILLTAKNNAIEFDHQVKIINPELVRENYVAALVEARQQKEMQAPVAKELLKDNVMLATMMLYRDEADGLVSGAIHTTANTIRPALQIIKTAPQFKLVSSVFFMCLPAQVLVYADCAINPDPDAESLADIAIQSALTAQRFGITPRIAMLSYSTGASGQGADVDKVRRATELVKSLRPDLLVDGPLQYDAALIEQVAQQKAPDSLVAGRATVLIFPDLNTGNTTYKAVQRSANVLSIGPILQGLKKPVNDLSRGASVSDIVYTIAITAIQADQRQ